MKACFWFGLLLGFTLPAAAADRPDNPLQSPTVVLCLRPLRLADEPGLREAVESVKRLTTFSETQEGRSKRAVDALAFIISDLFKKEEELTAAEKDLAKAERQALAKEELALRTETVGSPLSGPNPRLATMYRKEGEELLGKASRRHEAALKLMKEKIAAYNVSVGYFQAQGATEVVIALASSLFAVIDRHLPGFDFKPAVSREWVLKQKRMEA
ncbi:hypothetical protein [Prosthecobacter sp.]|uniref:hypothetical protein n=1 Tax=Prosthecobacter sp. TaxID=1965333 RepID=UPI0024881542|nr:hypothetical protein [Prosthecobacter sp.]MDI1311870.1 hypothetical protein [Prosthecobacter sp.]